MTRNPSGRSSMENYAFPVSPVQKEDTHKTMLNLCSGLTPKEARDALGSDLTPGLSLAHWVAGIRGVFERMGILLCSAGGDTRPASLGMGFKDELTKKRRLLLKGTMSFQSLLESEGLLCDTRRFSCFSRWLTAENSRGNYDVRYFVTSLPADQKPILRSRNRSTGIWITPERGMDLFQRGSLLVTFATFASVRSLADYDSWDSLSSEYKLQA